MRHALRCLAAVLRKNFILKRRLWRSTLLELLLPVALMGLIVWIRVEIKTVDKPAMNYITSPDNNPTWFSSQPMNITEYLLPFVKQAGLPEALVHEVESLCLRSTGLCPETFSSLWVPRKEYYLGVALDGLLLLHMALYRQKLGVVGADSASFANFVRSLPGYGNYVMDFGSVEDFTTYISNRQYGYAEDKPQLFGAIVFRDTAKKGPDGLFKGSWDVVIHLNATGPGSLDINGATDINTKSVLKTDPLLQGVKLDNTRIYWSGGLFTSSGIPLPTGGFIDLQSLVYAWIYNETGAFSTPASFPECRCTDSAGNLTDDLAKCSKSQLPILLMRLLTPHWSTATLNEGLRGCLGRFGGILPVSLREVPFPTPAHVDDTFAKILKATFGFFFVLVFIWPLTRIMKNLVEDKETKVNEVMKMMGMPAETITIGWYVTYGILWLLPSILIPGICATTVFLHSNKILVFLFFWLFGLCVITLCSCVAVFFAKAKTASVVGALIFFLLYFPYVFLEAPDQAIGAKTFACICPPVALSFGAGLIAQFESAGIGLQVGNLNDNIDNFTMTRVFLMMAWDVVFYAALAWYLDKVLVVGVGTRQPWCFCFLPRYWKSDASGMSRDEALELERAFDDTAPQNPKYEAVGETLASQRSLLVRDLSKEFYTADGKLLKAVNGITLNLYTGQIFCLLGHNGAGKTTTISMLSGMTPVTSGDAIVYGKSVCRDMRSIRQMLGVCPQHDVIWSSMTVLEHLEFFVKLKGLTGLEATREVEEIISDVGLGEKQHALAGTLSGGQKRRLSAAIALVGGSSVVFLDEPSSGVDPFSRRELWDCLKRKKSGRTVILTTHFMDEAEELGDRIAIMAAGQIKCVGSALFLKSKYGVGYSLTVTKRTNAGTHEAAALRQLISMSCPRAEILSEVGVEVVYRMPMEESERFPKLFETLEQRPEAYGVDFFSISVTTLEEVFLKVGQDHTQADLDADERLQQASFVRQLSEGRTNEVAGSVASNEGGIDDTDGRGLPARETMRTPLRVEEQPMRQRSITGSVFSRHLRALLVKRYHNARRDRKAWCCQVAMPLIFLLFALSTLKFSDLGSYQMSPVDVTSLPGNQDIIYAGGPGIQEDQVRKFMAGAGPSARALSGTYSAADFSEHLEQTWFRDTGLKQYGAFRFQSIPDFTGSVSGAVDGWTIAGFQNPGLVTNAKWPGGNLTVPVGTLWNETDHLEVNFPPFLNVNMTVPMSRLNNRLQVDLFWNSSARDAVPIYYHLLHEQLLKSATGQSQMSVSISNQPFPLTAGQKDLTDTSTSLNLALGFAFIPASVGAFVVLERENKSKHLQIISGVNFVSYWLATWIWDVINFLIPAALSILLISLFGIESLTSAENLPWTILCVLMYGFHCTSFTYMLSFLFDSHTSAQNLLLVVYLFTGGILMIVAIVLAIIPSTSDLLRHTLIYFFRVMPNFCLADALTNLITRSNPGLWMLAGCPPSGCEPYALLIAGYDLIFMGVGSVVCFLVTLLLELALATPRLRELVRLRPVDVEDRSAEEEDPDVRRERERVQSGAADRDMVVLKGLRKVYPGRSGVPPKVAVQNMCFGIPEGECFGYLGMNGAGKTTTMRILTGEELCTRGEATLGGYDIRTQQSEVRHLIGYCPQFDALIGTLTAREHLTLFARIKGVPADDLKRYVEIMLDKLTLSPYADKQAYTFSGGTRRKLSLGIALIGDPRCVFLDEPTTGVDPESRRFMWKLISGTMRGRSVILTTHSMDECEALCARIGIMVNGKLVCLGSASQLKATHGYGFQFEVTFDAASDFMIAFQRLSSFLAERFPGGVRCTEGQPPVGAPRDAYRQRVKFRLPKKHLPISAIFREVEQKRTWLMISEYSVSETTLEQIFINFAKHQEGVDGTSAVMACTSFGGVQPSGAEPTGAELQVSGRQVSLHATSSDKPGMGKAPPAQVLDP